jgi:hypothetical protein
MGALRELLGLFVDDGSLAVSLILWIAVLHLAAPALPLAAGAKAGLMAAGIVAILIENVSRSARRSGRR